MEPIIQVAIIFVAAAVLAYIAGIIRQPIIPAYILAGVILVLTGIIEADSLVNTISSLGIAFLLFLVGLEIDFKRLRDVGKVTTLGCIFISTFLFGIGFVSASFLGLSMMPAVYIGLVAVFSSTMIVVKLLSDKGQLDTLHGRIIIGILLMQDIIAIVDLFVLSTLRNGFMFVDLAATLGMMVGIFVLTFVFNVSLFPRIFKFAAKTEELLFITAVSVCLIYISLFHFLGLSIAIGAFVAGVALGNLPYNLEIIALVKPIRDFFAVVFFVALGMLLSIVDLNWPIIVVLFVITLLIKPLLMMIVITLFGYKSQTSFLSSLSLAQASEFGLILLLMGLSLGHIGEYLFSSVVLVTIVSMALTAYLFRYQKSFFPFFRDSFKFLEKIAPGGELEYDTKKIKKEVLMIGYDRLGYNIFDVLRKQKRNFIVVDYNPEVVKNLIKKKIPCMYGDIGDIEILRRLDIGHLKMIISTIPDKQDTLMLIKKAKEANRKALLIVTSSDIDDALELYKAGAHYVILPHFLGGEHVALLLEDIKGSAQKMLRYKINHLKELHHRKSLKHRHPRKQRHR